MKEFLVIMRFLIVFIAMCFIVSDAMVVSRAMNNGTFCDVCEKFIGDVRDHMQKVGECTRKVKNYYIYSQFITKR